MGTYRNKRLNGLIFTFVVLIPAIIVMLFIGWDSSDYRYYVLLFSLVMIIFTFIAIFKTKIIIKEGNLVIQQGFSRKEVIPINKITETKVSMIEKSDTRQKLTIKSEGKDYVIANPQLYKNFLPELNALMKNPVAEDENYKKDFSESYKNTSKLIFGLGGLMVLLGIIVTIRVPHILLVSLFSVGAIMFFTIGFLMRKEGNNK